MWSFCFARSCFCCTLHSCGGVAPHGSLVSCSSGVSERGSVALDRLVSYVGSWFVVVLRCVVIVWFLIVVLVYDC